MRLLLPTLLLVSLCSSHAVKYFGFYDDDINTTSAFTNFHQAGTLDDAIHAQSLGQHSLLSVNSIFFQSRQLKPNYSQVWASLVPTFKAALKDGKIFGFNLGDELVWNCIEPSDVQQAAKTIRDSMPRGEAILWYNEATGPVVDGKDSCGTVQHMLQRGTHATQVHTDFKIPSELDWYHMDGLVQGWVQAHVQVFYNQYIFPNLTADQSVLLVPGSFGSNVNHYPNGTYICDKACYDAMCAQDAQDFYTWVGPSLDLANSSNC